MQQIDQFQLTLGQGSEFGMIAILGLMMFSVALGLRSEHFRFFKTQPRIYFTGVAAQLLGLPALTLLLCFVFNPIPSVALGMLLISCCPGGNVSNLLVVLARGQAALSVSLTATSSLAAAFFTPVAILFLSALYPPTASLLTEIDFDASSFLIQTSLILVLPLLSGMLIAYFAPRFANRWRALLVAIASLGLLIIIASTLIKYADQFVVIGLPLLSIVVIHNAAAFSLGYISAKLARADAASTRALTFEVGIQNSGLGIVILLTQLGGLGGAAAVAGLWGVWHIVAGLMLVVIFRRFSAAD